MSVNTYRLMLCVIESLSWSSSSSSMHVSMTKRKTGAPARRLGSSYSRVVNWGILGVDEGGGGEGGDGG